MPNGQLTSAWSATAFSPVFGESAARMSAGVQYRTIFLLPTATEDRLGAELWGTKPTVANTLFTRKISGPDTLKISRAWTGTTPTKPGKETEDDVEDDSQD
jgi:hypothetical protein